MSYAGKQRSVGRDTNRVAGRLLVPIALVVGLLSIVAALGLVLAHGPDAVAGTSGVAPEEGVASFRSSTRLCQGGETLPRGTRTIFAWLAAGLGPKVTAQVRVNGRVLAQGERASGWTGKGVRISLAALPRTIADATVCLTFTPVSEVVTPGGKRSPHAMTTVNGRRRPWRVALEYLRPGEGSWWSRASSVIDHMGLGRLPSGVWAPVLAMLLALSLLIVVSVALLRELR